MCGIIGYLGKKKAVDVITSGLKRLDYRGYDSCGLAIKKEGFDIRKDVGTVEDFVRNSSPHSMKGNIGIGHTRWATHGGVTKENAHPHVSCDSSIAVVHNGIIENFSSLRSFLQSNGHSFASETDTEVIPHFIEHWMGKGLGFESAFRLTVSHLEGQFAIVALHRDEERMMAARRGCPLVLGIGKREYFVASDIPAFLEHTNRVVYLHDNDSISLGKEGFSVFNLEEGREAERPVDEVGWTLDMAEKGDFEHYMLKEISEQTETVRNASMHDRQIIERLSEEINNAYGIFFVGCGSSFHACLTGSYLFSSIAKKHVNVVLASEFPHQEDFLTEKSLIIAVSQSGETADVLEAVKKAREKGSKIISIVNAEGSSLARSSDHFLHMDAGPEICVLSTKTYTSQVALLLLLAYSCAGRYDEGKKALTYAWNLIYNLTSRNTRDKLRQLAAILRDKQNVFAIGRGLLYPTALEAALKIKEVSYIHAEGFAGGELKHGTIALIEKGTPCIVFVPSRGKEETLSNAIEIRSRGGYIIGIGPEQSEVFDFFIKVPDVGLASPITDIIPVQILSYYLAVLRGLDPDRPRNLAKSVTVK